MQGAPLRFGRRLLYALLAAVVALREALLRLRAAAAALPWVIAIREALRGRRGPPKRGKAHRGAPPPRPSVLGVVAAESTFGPLEDQGVCRLLSWAHSQGFRHVLLYDPGGELQSHRAAIESGLEGLDPEGAIALWSGWHAPGGDDFLEDQQGMGVALLSAADVEEPLEGAAVAGTRGPPPEGLDAAVAAPADVRARLAAAAGPLAGVEADIVVVFGPALSLAGFPPWAVRTAEIFEVGALAGVTRGKLDAVLRRYLGVRQRFGK